MRFREVFRNASGIALITVLLVGSAISVVASTAAFVTIRELRAGTDDRKGAEALAHAEAGVDRLLQYLRSGGVTWGDIRLAGCTFNGVSYPPFTFVGGPNGGQGTVVSPSGFTADLRVYDRTASGAARFPPTACPTSEPQAPKGSASRYFVITSTGQSPAARRVVRQVIQVRALGLPVGLYADRTDAGGTPAIGNCSPGAPAGQGISLVTRFDVGGRSQLGFCGTDPYYTLQDFWPSLSSATRAPSAIHSTGTIFLKQNLLNDREHPPVLNCTANTRGTPFQSKWDQSFPGGPITSTCAIFGDTGPVPPPTSHFSEADRLRVAPRPQLTEQDYATLKSTALEGGLYCFIPSLVTATASCLERGQPSALNPRAAIAAVPAGLDNNFVAYFEFEKDDGVSGIQWTASYGRCNDPPSPTSPNQSYVLVVRRGNIREVAGGINRGVFLIPEGAFVQRGGGTIVGSVIAESIDLGGSGTVRLDECWVKNMPGPYMNFLPFHFSEVDR